MHQQHLGTVLEDTVDADSKSMHQGEEGMTVAAVTALGCPGAHVRRSQGRQHAGQVPICVAKQVMCINTSQAVTAVCRRADHRAVDG